MESQKIPVTQFLQTFIYTTILFFFSIAYICISIDGSSFWGFDISPSTFWVIYNMQYTLSYAYAGIVFGISFVWLYQKKYFWVVMPLILLGVNWLYVGLIDDVQNWSWIDRWIMEDPNYWRMLTILRE